MASRTPRTRGRGTLRGGVVRMGLALASGWMLAGCSSEAPGERPVEEVLAEHNPELLAIPGVMGSGITDWEGRSLILVFVEDRESESVARIPGEIDGYTVVVVDRRRIREWTGLDQP